MTWIAATSLAAAAVALAIGVGALQVGSAPGWRPLRAFAWVAFSAGACIAANLVNTLPAGDTTVVWLTRLQLAALLLHAAAWLRFASLQLAFPLRWERWVLVAMVAAAPTCLVPGLAFTDAVVHHQVNLLGVGYADLPPTLYGVALMAGTLAMAAVVIGRFVHAWRMGDGRAGVVAGAIALACLMGANDALVTSGLLPGIYLVDLGFLVPIAAVARALAARFASEARDLGELRDRLEALVRDRTVALERTTRGLVESERMAAMARLSAGVAHEINNPAAALGANLRYLAENLRAGEPVPADAMESLADSGALIARISGYVRHLVDASRLAGAAPRFGAVASLGRAVGDAMFLGPHGIRVEVPVDLRVAIDPEVLTQALGVVLRTLSRDFSRPLRVTARREGTVAHLAVARSPPSTLPPAPASEAAQNDLAVAAGLLGIYGARLVQSDEGVAIALPLATGAPSGQVPARHET